MMSPFSVIWLLISSGVSVAALITLLFDWAPISSLFNFGKLMRSSDDHDTSSLTRNYKKLIEIIQVPKRWFIHFYYFGILVLLMSTVISLKCINGGCYHLEMFLKFIFNHDSKVGGDIFYQKYQDTSIQRNVIMMYALFGIQLIRRLLEEKFLFISSTATINLIHYAMGFLFYGSFTLLLLSYSVTRLDVASNDGTNFRIILAMLLFLIGQYIQYSSHKSLANLRRGMSIEDRRNLDKAYLIPRGRFFELVSCPNYFAECLIYTCFLFLSQFEWNMCSLVIWVLSNQTFASLACHAWYRKKFSRLYPRNRRAIFPFIL
ncbi:polyprenal reductase-like isoform X1 [Brevipalpus obovatus]|uniref:polyprenal reductase-like isoform X1 n=1 Tax=Brevipalpus obovatus TaxID=246614 RepID=UPI003D9E6FB1